MQAKLLAKTGKYAVIVAAGFVVDGGIYRHEFVSETVIGALMRIQLDTEIPIISVVLTPQMSYCQKLCMGLSCGGAILAFSIHEFRRLE